MNTQRVILVTEDGPGTQAAVDLLTEWARQGLIHPFITYTSKHHAAFIGTHGKSEPSSVFEILGRQKLDVIRVSALAGADLSNVVELERRTLKLVNQIKDDLAPEGLQVVQVRMWAPDDPRADGSWAVPEHTFSSAANANLVLIPEDRQTEDKVGVPLTRSGNGPYHTYGSHVATELATALGMWSAMTEAPVDVMEAGVHGYREARVHLVRSFVRIAEIPAVSLAGAADHGGVLRVPPGCQEAPYPLETLAYAQDRIGNLLDGELVRTGPSRQAERVGLAEFVQEIGRGIVRSLRYMFTISADVIDALRDMAGRVVQDAVGIDSVLRVVWRGMPSDGDEPQQAVDAEQMITTLRRRRALEGGVRIDQRLWGSVGNAVFSLADGGSMPEGIEPLKIDGRTVIVKEVGILSPVHGPNLAEDIREEAFEGAPTTLLGRLANHLRLAEQRSRREFCILVEASKKIFDVEQPPALTPAGVVVSALIALIATGLLVLSGLVELVGITDMGNAARGWIWSAVTAVYALVLVMLTRAVTPREGGLLARWRRRLHRDGDEEVAVARTTEEAAANGSDKPQHQVARSAGGQANDEVGRSSLERARLRGVIALAALAGVIAFVVDVTRRGGFRWDSLALGTTLALILYAIGLAIRLDRKPYRSLETFRQVRMLFFFTVIYGAFGLVGLLARTNGWYGDLRPEEFVSLWIWLAVLVILVLLLLLAMAFDSFRRDKRARTKVSDLEREIVAAVDTQWVTEEALEQLVGSAAAWAAVMWKPFGEFDPGEGRTREGVAFDVLKAETRPYVVTPLGALAMRERMMKELAKPGWLSRRYQTAVEVYRRRRAIETGTDPTAILPPDHDPREVHTVPPEDRSRVSGRWRFLSDLTAGTYDRELAQAMDTLDHATAAEWAYKQEGTLEASAAGGESLEQYLGVLAPQGDSQVSHVYFVLDARPDADRSYESSLWWPSALLDRPGDRPAKESHIRSLVNGDLVVMSVRHDIAGPYTPSALFESTEDDDKTEDGPGSISADDSDLRSTRGPRIVRRGRSRSDTVDRPRL